ncbi:CD226 antigen [Pipistrellus kuhlii]|uniref:CD226 molecule n=1 Tax=Pipistrellus kuhlii TaxID=59472 RepID=A0A7J7Y7Q0_PIPKU|nr:CD226 antigen [Pipistrellus kuhlii]KAF6357959.1 CD226 molecule [Pipistrellus kuhlii]
MDYFTFLVALLHLHKALGEEVFWNTRVKLAETLTLECQYPLLGTLVQMEWFKINATKKESMAIYHPNFGSVIRDPYADRVYFLKSTSDPNNMMLAFYNASEADIGAYSCLLEIFPYGSWEKVVQVVPPDSFEIAVPSDSHVISKPGENITFMYELQTKDPMQQVTWEKIQSHQIDLLTRCNLSQGKISPSRFRRQILTNCSQGMRRSFILLPHVEASDSGLYRCCFKASTGENETFVVRLTVTDGKNDNQRVFWIIVGTALLLVFVLLIPIVIVLLYIRKRCRQKNIQDKESQATQNKASNNNRSSFSVSQPSDGAGEDIYVNYPTFSRRPKTRA